MEEEKESTVTRAGNFLARYANTTQTRTKLMDLDQGLLGSCPYRVDMLRTRKFSVVFVLPVKKLCFNIIDFYYYIKYLNLYRIRVGFCCYEV